MIQSQWLKPYTEFNSKKGIKAEKNNDKVGKILYKLMSNAIYGNTMENVRNRIDVKLVNNKKRLFKMYMKIKLYVAQYI